MHVVFEPDRAGQNCPIADVARAGDAGLCNYQTFFAEAIVVREKASFFMLDGSA
jgi:hypothetical protein